jgi:hypothetical protein
MRLIHLSFICPDFIVRRRVYVRRRTIYAQPLSSDALSRGRQHAYYWIILRRNLRTECKRLGDSNFPVTKSH